MLLVGLAPLSRGTSIAIKLERDRIFLAADTRESRSAGVANQDTSEFRNDFCKIVPLGKIGFAVTGHADYHASGPGDALRDWDARDDARTVNSQYPDNITSMSDEWGRRAGLHYLSFYRVDANRVRGLAAMNSANLIVEGIFVGWKSKREPITRAEDIFFDPGAVGGIQAHYTEFAFSELPFSTNDTTAELIKGQTERAKAVAARWAKEGTHVAKSQRDWQYLEFLIQATADYDPAVGKNVDVLEVRPNGHYKWLRHH